MTGSGRVGPSRTAEPVKVEGRVTGNFKGVLTNVVAVAGLLATMFYIMTAMATTVYYRRKALAGPRDFLTVGVFPVAAIVFLIYVMWKYLSQSPAGQTWTIAAIIASGIAAMIVARFRWRTGFFSARLESWRLGTGNGGA